MEQTGLEFGVMLGLEIVYPKQNVTSSQARCHWVFPQLATFPTIEMLSRVTTNRLEGEASVGREPSLLSSKEGTRPNRVPNITTSHIGDLGGLGLTQLEVQRLQNTPAPAASEKGCVCSCSNAHIDATMCLSGSCHFKQCELLSEEVTWKMPQLSLIK